MSYRSDDPTTGELLQQRLKDLDRYNDQIELGKDAAERKPDLLIEINGLYRQLMDEEDV